MTRRPFLILMGMLVGVGLLLGLGSKPPPSVLAKPEVYASPVHAGCYLARSDRCKIHVEPFTINLASGEKLVKFRLVATRVGSGTQTTIYDFRPDQSNPLPVSGSAITPSLVAKDFAATCGQTYSISLQGQDTGDANLLNLGSTGQFTCPKGTYRQFLPMIGR
jgi:hypothetical protein